MKRIVIASLVTGALAVLQACSNDDGRSSSSQGGIPAEAMAGVPAAPSADAVAGEGDKSAAHAEVGLVCADGPMSEEAMIRGDATLGLADACVKEGGVVGTSHVNTGRSCQHPIGCCAGLVPKADDGNPLQIIRCAK